jgi:hypothetical protein
MYVTPPSFPLTQPPHFSQWEEDDQEDVADGDPDDEEFEGGGLGMLEAEAEPYDLQLVPEDDPEQDDAAHRYRNGRFPIAIPGPDGGRH